MLGQMFRHSFWASIVFDCPWKKVFWKGVLHWVSTTIVSKKGKRMFVLLSFYLKSSHFNHELESRKILLLTKESYAMYVTKVQGSQLQIIYLWRNCIIMLHNPYSLVISRPLIINAIHHECTDSSNDWKIGVPSFLKKK